MLERWLVQCKIDAIVVVVVLLVLGCSGFCKHAGRDGVKWRESYRVCQVAGLWILLCLMGGGMLRFHLGGDT